MSVDAQVIATSRAVLAEHGRTFRLAGTLLSRDRLDDAAVLYAFCRAVDDAVDEASSVEEGQRQLTALRDELAGKAERRPLIVALVDVAARRGMPLAAAEELMLGVASDTGTVRMEDDGELLRYCYRVAGTVGLMMCGILGVQAVHAAPHAIDLGIGMQLTNICRDVAEDARMGRVYLPAARLKRQGLTQQALLDGGIDASALASVVADLLSLAERYYASGRAGLGYIPLGPRAAISAAGRVYGAIGHVLARRNYDALRGRAVVGQSERVLWLLRAAIEAPLMSLKVPGMHQRKLHTQLAGLPGTNT